MSRNERLYRARLSRRWSQEKAAEKSGIARKTYIELETGKRAPQIGTLDLLCLAFHASPQELGYNTIGLPLAEGTVKSPDQAVQGEQDGSFPLLTPEQNEQSLVTLTSEELAAFSEFLKTGESMALPFDESKRTLLRNLFEIAGIAALGSQTSIDSEPWRRFFSSIKEPPKSIDDALVDHFEQQVRLCWNLLKGDDLPVVPQLLPTYLPSLETLARQSSKHQKAFAGLAAQGCLIAGLVTALQLNTSVPETYCKQAVQYSRLAEDRNLEAASLKHLATRYNDAKYPLKVLHTYQEALPLVNQSMNDEKRVSPLLCSRTYLGLALASAQLGKKQEALYYLGFAQDTFPERVEDDPSFSYADCGPSSFNHYGGLIYLEFDQPKEAWETFAGVEQLQSTLVVPERTIFEIKNCQTVAAVAQGDLELASAQIQNCVEGAIRLKSEMRFAEALSIYKQMKMLWPHELKIKALADLFQR